METETYEGGTNGANHTSIGDNIAELAESSKQLMEAGKRITDNLTELTQRADRASDVISQTLRSPWLVAAVAITAGTLILILSRRD